MTRAEQARQYFLDGYNCSQAVAMAFADMMQTEPKSVARLTSGFGGGMSRLREVCGSISGMVFVMSALYGYDEAADFAGKKQLYAEVQSLAEQFRERHGSIVCRELLELRKGASSPVPEQRTEEYYRKRPCAALIYSSAEILENYISEKEK